VWIFKSEKFVGAWGLQVVDDLFLTANSGDVTADLCIFTVQLLLKQLLDTETKL